MASRRGAAGRRPDGVRWHRSRLLGRGRRHVPSLKGANGPLSGGRGATARVVLPAARRPAAPQDGSVGRGQEHRDATLGGRAGSAARRARRLAARRARRSQGPGRASAGARDRGHAISCTPWGPSSTSPTIQWRCARSFACSGPEGRPSSGCPTGSIRFSAPCSSSASTEWAITATGWRSRSRRPPSSASSRRAGFRVTAATGLLFMPGALRMLDLWAHTPHPVALASHGRRPPALPVAGGSRAGRPSSRVPDRLRRRAACIARGASRRGGAHSPCCRGPGAM